MIDTIKKLSIDKNATINAALKKMDEVGRKLLIVVHGGKFISMLSIGDIQRAIIKNIDLSEPVNRIVREHVKVAAADDDLEKIKNEMKVRRNEFMPVLAQDGSVARIIFWEDLFQEKKPRPTRHFDLPVVIMAGGFGTRLRPLTNVLPKPLVPFGEKTIIEEIFERFANHGCKNFYISVNYKAELIEFYLWNQNLPYQLKFFKEQQPQGTAGSLSLLRGKIRQTFFVSNCDILIDQDYTEILDYHKKNKNEITIVAAIKNIPLPYGTIQTGENGQLLELTEKPELTFKINSGMYILEPHLLDEIPADGVFPITELIENVKSRNGIIGVFPVSDKSWIDIGSWKNLKFAEY
jgi:dTDP-glucose pyrophosphorylase